MEIEMKQFEIKSRNRGMTYERLIGIFTYLPDGKYWETVCSEEFIKFLVRFREVGHVKIVKGVNLVLDFIKENQIRADERLFEKLGVDRTRLVRASFNNAFKLPYENLYCEKTKISNLLLNLKTTYGKLGYVPIDTREALDFFCVEMDFLKLLSLQLNRSPEETQMLLKSSADFLDNHLGRWIGKYAEAAILEAETTFFQGWLLFLEGFIDLEGKYLRSLL